MRFFAGFIVGVAVVVGGVLFHDGAPTSASRPIVNWSNAAYSKEYMVEYFSARFDRLLKWATRQY